MTTKHIELSVGPSEPHMVGDGFRVHNFIPSLYRLDRIRTDPFILLDYNSKTMVPPSESPKGVGVHPHRGFETVTLAYKGRVAHHDSTGNSGIIREGEVQWMTAASGILHKEYHEESFSRSGGLFQMVQLWVNLPAKEKMSPPRYQAIDKSLIQSVMLADGLGQVEVIAGNYQGVKGPAKTFSPIHAMNAFLMTDAEAKFEFPANYNTILLVIEGKILINGSQTIDLDHLVLFENSGETFVLKALEQSCVLILSGEPLGEPIEANGPFVMNTKQELIQAIRDFHDGKFGTLED